MQNEERPYTNRSVYLSKFDLLSDNKFDFDLEMISSFTVDFNLRYISGSTVGLEGKSCDVLDEGMSTEGLVMLVETIIGWASGSLPPNGN